MRATIAPMSVQTALSVGDPVKNLETLELKEIRGVDAKNNEQNSARNQGQKNHLVLKHFQQFFKNGSL